MTRIAELRKVTDHLKAAELEAEGAKISLRLSPRATFILENLQHRLSGSRTRVATDLFEAACLDWLESQNIDPESQAFKDKYYKWLTREPVEVGPNGEEYTEYVLL